MATKTKKKGVSFSTIFNVVLVILFVIALVVLVCAIYYFQDPPTTQKTLYTSALTYAQEDENGEQPYPIEVKVYKNLNENGLGVYDVKFNYYTDTTIPETEDEYKNVYSAGFQFIDNVSMYNPNRFSLGVWCSFFDTVFSNVAYYNSTNGVSFYAINSLSPDDSWIVDYTFSETVNGVETTSNNLAKLYQRGWVQTGSGSLGWRYFENRNIYSALLNLIQSSASLSDGVYILQLDMSDYFTFKIYNQETGQFDVDTSDNMSVLANVKITVSSNGLVDSSQSLFGQVAYDADYSYGDVAPSDYWESKTIYSLTANDFSFSTNDDGLVVATIKEDILEYISQFKRLYLRIYINLDSFYFDGLAENAFGGLPVDQVTITSSIETGFAIYEDYNIIADDTVTIIDMEVAHNA